jgi:hypothetical protein
MRLDDGSEETVRLGGGCRFAVDTGDRCDGGGSTTARWGLSEACCCCWCCSVTTAFRRLSLFLSPLRKGTTNQL